jgi:Patatin-like phospholipase
MNLTHIPHLTISLHTALAPAQVNNNPPQAKVWRNYNYPPGQRSRYPGAFRINTVTAVRATSAAPTFFTPVQWEKGLYCDGALVANNPTAIALQEAKVRGKHVECTVISFNARILHGLNSTYYTYPGILLSPPLPSLPFASYVGFFFTLN